MAHTPAEFDEANSAWFTEVVVTATSGDALIEVSVVRAPIAAADVEAKEFP